MQLSNNTAGVTETGSAHSDDTWTNRFQFKGDVKTGLLTGHAALYRVHTITAAQQTGHTTASVHTATPRA